jgi:type I restriction enzyme S subunit
MVVNSMSYATYDSYKDSGVDWLGEIPNDWDVCKLKFLLDEVNVRSKSGNEELLSLSKYQGIIPKNSLDERSGGASTLVGYKKVFKETLVINKMQATNGLLAISKIEGITSPDYSIYKTKNNEILDIDYLGFLLTLNLYLSEFKKRVTGVMEGFIRLYTDDLYEIHSIIPPITQQKKIVNFLNQKTAQIDQAIALKQQQIEKLNEYKQIVIQNAVTKGLNPNAPMKNSGVDWIGDIPEHWEIKKLKFLCNFDTGNKDTVNAIDDGVYPLFVRSQNIERIDEFTHDCEAVLTAGDGAGVGKVFHYYKGKFCFHQRVYMFNNFREISGRYFYYYFSSLFYKVALDGSAKSTVDSLRRPMIANFPIVYPETQEQLRIVEYLDKKMNSFIKSENLYQTQIDRLKEYKNILINQAVTGKIKI